MNDFTEVSSEIKASVNTTYIYFSQFKILKFPKIIHLVLKEIQSIHGSIDDNNALQFVTLKSSIKVLLG